MAPAAPEAPEHLFRAHARTLVGVVHLPRLVDAANPVRPSDLIARAVSDATAYRQAGFDALIVENYGDAPFAKTDNPAAEVALTAVAARTVRDATQLPVGVNLLRNDGIGALAACHAADGAFVRINVLTGVAVTDQGLIEGDAHAVAAERRRLGRHDGPDRIRIMADIDVKHAAPLVARPLDVVAEETVQRGGADGLLVTGTGTGKATDLDHVRIIRDAVDVPVWVASGITPDTVALALEWSDGVIVGTGAKRHGVTTEPVDPQRADAIARAAGKA